MMSGDAMRSANGAIGKQWPPHGVAAALACLASGCTLLIKVDTPQCERDQQCIDVGLGTSCNDGVCVGELTGAEACDSGVGCGINAATVPPPDVAAPTTDDCGGATCEPARACFDGACIPRDLYEQVVCSPRSPAAGGMVEFQMHIQEFVSERPPRDLSVRACRTMDVTCESPVATWKDESGEGDLVMELPTAFIGYLEVDSSDALPSLWYFTRPVFEDTRSKDLLVVAPSTLTLLAAIAGFAVDSSKGLVILEAFDCDRVALGGVHFDESRGNAQPFYIVDEIPNTDVNVSVRDELNDIAIGGFLNTEPGFVRFAARLGVEGPLLGEFNARVRANTVTYLDIHRPRDMEDPDE